MPANSTSIQPPVGGWDTRNALADMPEENAVILDNWFPSTDRVTLRRGSAGHASGMSGNVNTLLEYTAPDGSSELFAANGSNIYDVTSAGAVGAAVVTGLSNDQLQQTQITTAGGSFLFAVNGADGARTYDGTNWGTANITGPTVANLIWCNLHQRRLWFGEAGSLRAWYLPVNSIAAAASSFDLGAVAKRGGFIMAMGTWTRDAGDGSDDVAVFLTSEGEAIVYQGTDPSSVATWALVGVFTIGEPIGRRCMIKAGSDLVMITQDGFVSASAVLAIDRSQTERAAISAQINEAVNVAVRGNRASFGWQPIIYPRGQWLLFNVPQPNNAFHQYVFNTITGAPCRFTGMNARCWGMLGDEIYFGTADGRVVKADIGMNDDGAVIEGDALQAFSYFRSPGRHKAFKRVEAVFQSADDPQAALDLNVDFQIAAPTGVATQSGSGAARWGISRWGVGTWGSPRQIWRGWRAIRGAGFAASLRVRVNSRTATPSWIATNYLYAPGGRL